MIAAPNTQYLARPEGRLGYDVTGEGPLIVLIPGTGDLRAGPSWDRLRRVEGSSGIVRAEARRSRSPGRG